MTGLYIILPAARKKSVLTGKRELVLIVSFGFSSLFLTVMSSLKDDFTKWCRDARIDRFEQNTSDNELIAPRRVESSEPVK